MTQWHRWKNIMKCYPFEEKRLAKWDPPYIVQPKYNGIRCRALRLHNGGWILLSSEENIIYSVPHIYNNLINQSPPFTELDGELYSHGMSFEEILSITSRTVNVHPDHKKIQFHIFDYVSEEPQTARITRLSTTQFIEPLINSPYWICDDLIEIMEVYNELISLGYEGIIVRHFLAYYEKKRSTYVMKFKPKKEDTYEIIGVNEEISKDGIPKGRLGSVTCDSGDGNSFNVGSGFSSNDRKLLWNTKLIGKKVRVQYQHITSRNKVPRFPIFMEVIK